MSLPGRRRQSGEIAPRPTPQPWEKSAVTTRPLLSGEEIRALDDALLDFYRDHAALCLAHPVAKGRISRPAIPAAFSESFAAFILSMFVAEVATVEFGGRSADLIATTTEGQSLRVEVKASGVSRWQELKPRDLDADGLVWVDFARRYLDQGGPVTIYFLPRPSRYEPPRRKLTLDLFLAGASMIDGFASHTFASLHEAIGIPRNHGLDDRVGPPGTA